jgi:hypothetical protein
MYCNYMQDNWCLLLPLGEFAYNNTLNDTTGVTPFFTNKGYHPSVTVHPERDLTDARTDGLILPMTGIKSQIGGYSRGRF